MAFWEQLNCYASNQADNKKKYKRQTANIGKEKGVTVIDSANNAVYMRFENFLGDTNYWSSLKKNRWPKKSYMLNRCGNCSWKCVEAAATRGQTSTGEIISSVNSNKKAKEAQHKI